MSSSLTASLVRFWTRMYTKGLPAEVRTVRRAEIESDLWEQVMVWTKQDSTGLTAQHLIRLLLGIPADLQWRLEQARSSRREHTQEKRAMTDSISSRIILFAAMAVALVPTVMGATVLAGNGDLSSTERPIFGSLSMLVGVLMAAGLLLSRGSPRLGLGLVVAGAVGIAVLWFWAFFITIPIGLGLIWLARQRGKGLDLSHGSGGA